MSNVEVLLGCINGTVPVARRDPQFFMKLTSLPFVNFRKIGIWERPSKPTILQDPPLNFPKVRLQTKADSYHSCGGNIAMWLKLRIR